MLITNYEQPILFCRRCPRIIGLEVALAVVLLQLGCDSVGDFTRFVGSSPISTMVETSQAQPVVNHKLSQSQSPTKVQSSNPSNPKHQLIGWASINGLTIWIYLVIWCDLQAWPFGIPGDTHGESYATIPRITRSWDSRPLKAYAPCVFCSSDTPVQ